jgi:hypothetical protein
MKHYAGIDVSWECSSVSIVDGRAAHLKVCALRHALR